MFYDGFCFFSLISTLKIEAQYVLNPISCNVRASIAKETDLSRPKVMLEVALDDLGFGIAPLPTFLEFIPCDYF
jgi:hypothetical protein